MNEVYVLMRAQRTLDPYLLLGLHETLEGAQAYAHERRWYVADGEQPLVWAKTTLAAWTRDNFSEYAPDSSVWEAMREWIDAQGNMPLRERERWVIIQKHVQS